MDVSYKRSHTDAAPVTLIEGARGEPMLFGFCRFMMMDSGG